MKRSTSRWLRPRGRWRSRDCRVARGACAGLLLRRRQSRSRRWNPFRRGVWRAGVAPAGRGGGLLIGGSLPLVGQTQFRYLQLAPFLYPAEICLPSGRALRTGELIALPPVLAVECPSADDALASAWIDDARAELASVPSFLRLAAELSAVGTPTELREVEWCAAAGGSSVKEAVTEVAWKICARTHARFRKPGVALLERETHGGRAQLHTRER